MKLEAKSIGTLTATQNLTDVDFTIENVRIQVCSDITSFGRHYAYRNIVKRDEMENEMTLYHAIEPIKKCFVPDTPFLWPIMNYWTLDGSAWHHNYHGYMTPRKASYVNFQPKCFTFVDVGHVQAICFHFSLVISIPDNPFLWDYTTLVATSLANYSGHRNKGLIYTIVKSDLVISP